MEVYYRPSPELTIKIEAKDLEDVFDKLGPVQEVIGSNTECGKCKSTNVRLLHRTTPDKHDVYEIVCQAHGCFAKLAIGNGADGLFPRRYEQDPNDKKKPRLDADGKKIWLPTKGWVKWDNKAKKYV